MKKTAQPLTFPQLGVAPAATGAGTRAALLDAAAQHTAPHLLRLRHRRFDERRDEHEHGRAEAAGESLGRQLHPEHLQAEAEPGVVVGEVAALGGREEELRRHPRCPGRVAGTCRTAATRATGSAAAALMHGGCGGCKAGPHRGWSRRARWPARPPRRRAPAATPPQPRKQRRSPEPKRWSRPAGPPPRRL